MFITKDEFICRPCNIYWHADANPPPKCPNCGQPWTAIPEDAVSDLEDRG